VSVTKTEVYTILRDVCIVSNRLTYIDSKLSEMEILAQPLCETVFTPTTFRHTKRLPIRISKPFHKKFHFKNKQQSFKESTWYYSALNATLYFFGWFVFAEFKTSNKLSIRSTKLAVQTAAASK
jgi:hypothetical protein